MARCGREGGVPRNSRHHHSCMSRRNPCWMIRSRARGGDALGDVLSIPFPFLPGTGSAPLYPWPSDRCVSGGLVDALLPVSSAPWLMTCAETRSVATRGCGCDCVAACSSACSSVSPTKCLLVGAMQIPMAGCRPRCSVANCHCLCLHSTGSHCW